MNLWKISYVTFLNYAKYTNFSCSSAQKRTFTKLFIFRIILIKILALIAFFTGSIYTVKRQAQKHDNGGVPWIFGN